MLEEGALKHWQAEFFYLRIEPLTFREFVELKGHDIPIENLHLAGNILKPLFYEYI